MSKISHIPPTQQPSDGRCHNRQWVKGSKDMWRCTAPPLYAVTWTNGLVSEVCEEHAAQARGARNAAETLVRITTLTSQEPDS